MQILYDLCHIELIDLDIFIVIDIHILTRRFSNLNSLANQSARNNGIYKFTTLRTGYIHYNCYSHSDQKVFKS